MNKNLDVKVKGKFHFKNANLTIDNGITDWGMSRLAGHVRHNCWSVAENFYYLFLGSSNATTHPLGLEKYTLIAPIYERAYNISSSASIDIFHDPDPTKTKTEYEVLPTGDMIVRYHQTFKVYFNSATTIGEVGIGPAYYNSGGPITPAPAAPTGFSGPGVWPRTAAVGTLGFTTTRGDVWGNTFTVDFPARASHSDDANYSIFSRATVPSPRAKYAAGSNEEVTYVCEFTICQKAVGFLTGVNLNLAAVTGALPEDQFPANKSFIAQCPFFRLDGNRTPKTTVGGVPRDLIFSGGGSRTGALGEYNTYGANKQLIPPVFDSCSSNPLNPAGPEERGVWMLEFFEETGTTGAIGEYNTLTPYMSTDPWDVTDTSSAVIDFPINAEMLVVPHPVGLNNIRSSITYVTPSRYLRTSNPPAGLWQTKLTFAFTTDDLIEPVKSFALWRGLNENKQIKEDWRGFAGIFTMFETPWEPPTGRVVELNYTFTWQR